VGDVEGLPAHLGITGEPEVEPDQEDGGDGGDEEEVELGPGVEVPDESAWDRAPLGEGWEKITSRRAATATGARDPLQR
jgi:hypothetical protein